MRLILRQHPSLHATRVRVLNLYHTFARVSRQTTTLYYIPRACFSHCSLSTLIERGCNIICIDINEALIFNFHALL